MKNYDPNNRFGNHLVELTFQQWEYKLTVEITVGGNCKGLSIIQYAVERFLDSQYREVGDDPEYITLIMTSDSGDQLETEIDVNDDEELKDMLVSARILSFTKE